MTSLRLHMTLIGALALSGCGLISSDVTNFDLTLPEKSFSVDASGYQINQQAADTFLGTSCASSPNVCASAASSACPMDCTGECSTTTSKCVLNLDVGVYQMIDLVSEKPELKSINDEPVIKVTIDSVTYRVPQNTLNVGTPQMTVYVAPMSVMDPKDPMAKQVGTIAPVAAGQTVGMADMAYTSDGKQNLMDVMSTYKNPFNVIVGADLEVKQGDPVPTGRLDAVVQIKAHAGL
jgi:hypothetical protein